MFFHWWFNKRRTEFFRRKDAILKISKGYEEAGDYSSSKYLLEVIDHLQNESDQIAMHYLSGGTALNRWMFWRIWGFSSSLNDLEDSLKPVWRQLFETFFFVGGTVFLIKTLWFTQYTVPSESAEPNLLIGDRLVCVKYPYIVGEPQRGDLVAFTEVGFEYSSNPLLRWYQRYIGLGIGPLPAGPDAWTKRLIGLPGDRIKLSVSDQGRAEIFVNGKLLDEPFRNSYPLIQIKRTSGFLEKGHWVTALPVLGQLVSSLLEKKIKYHRASFDPSRPMDDQPFYDLNYSGIDVLINPNTGNPIVFWPEKANVKLDDQLEFVIPPDQVFGVGDNRHGSSDCRAWGTIPMSSVYGRVSFIYFSLDGNESWWFMELLKDPVAFFTKKIRWSRCFRFLHPFKELPKS